MPSCVEVLDPNFQKMAPKPSPMMVVSAYLHCSSLQKYLYRREGQDSLQLKREVEDCM